MRSLVTTSLAAAVAAAGLASGWHPTAQASSSLWAAQASQLASQHLSLLAVEAFEKGSFLVEFNEPGLLARHQERQARSSNPEGFNFNSAQTQADLQTLKRIQSQHVSAIRAAGLNRAPSHYYLATHSGIAIHVESLAELNALRSLSFVKSVTQSGYQVLDTHRSAAFVGADKIWDGTAVPGGTGTKGEGMVVAILDTGIDPARPSFGNDANCGFDAATPKLLSYLDCSSTDANGMCNGSNPVDTNGHGTHVASTAAGNVVTRADDPALDPSDGDSISGIAPCAQIRAYKVCATNQCGDNDIRAGMNSVLQHGDVNSMNFSISGGRTPWTDGDGDRQKLELVVPGDGGLGVFVAASAGNTRAATPNPIGQVNHLGPWVMTVASSTHDRQEAALDVSAGPASANPPPETQGMELSRGSESPEAPAGTLPLKRPEASNELGCDPHPANYFNGQAALIHRGDCAFTLKVQNAYDAGAAMVIIRNNQAGTLLMNTTGQPNVPAYSIGSQAIGDALAAFVAANEGVANVTMAPSFPAGDVLSDFSLRGPTSGNAANLTKPDITAPGDSVYAAVPGGYAWMGGTSMSSPQVAGAGALMRKIHPTWTATEVKSALMMTAKTVGQKDGVNGTPNTGNWDADDVGNGRMDLTRAAKAGLVMGETRNNFLGSNPAAGGDPRTLNLPSMRDVTCSPSCTWTRTVRNTLDVAANWTVEAEGFDGKMNITVSPTSFSFTGDTSETQELTITATPVGNQTAAMAFGQVTLKAAADASPDMHMTVAIKGVQTVDPMIEVDPTLISATAPSGSSTVVNRTLRISNIGGGDLVWSHDTAAGGSGGTFVHDQPVAGTSGLISAYSLEAGAGANTAADFTLTTETTLSKIEVYGFDNDVSSNILETSTALNWVIYPDDGDKPNGNFSTTPPHQGSTWVFSTAPNGAGVTLSEDGVRMTAALDLQAAGENVVLQPGKYWLTFYPTMPGALSPRFNWYGSEQVGSGSMLIAPNPPFNVDEWTLTGAGGLGTSVSDVAFKLEGSQGSALCDASWISIDPTSGTIADGEHTDVTVSLNPTGLADGVHTAAVCLSSNSGGNAGTVTVVPVTFTIDGDEPNGPEANLGVNASGAPESVAAGGNVSFLISAVNFGPDEATDVKVELTLPGAMSFLSGASVPVSTQKHPSESSNRANNWSCSDDANVVTCEHDGPLTGIAQPLRVDVRIDSAAQPGVLSTTIAISATEEDPSPANNTTTVLINVVGDDIFSDDFEEIPVDPDLVDSGPVELTLLQSDDKVLNLLTGAFEDYTSAGPGGDINLYRATTGLSAYLYGDSVPGQGAVSIAEGSPQIAVLQAGTTIGPNSPFTSSGGDNMLNWHAGVTGYVGLKFMNEETGEFNYGYVEIETTGPSAYPVKITRYVYHKGGEAITITTP